MARHSLGIRAPAPGAVCEARGYESDRRGEPGGQSPAERVIVLPEGEFDTLVGRPGYLLRDNGDLECREGSLLYLIVRQQSNRALPMGE